MIIDPYRFGAPATPQPNFANVKFGANFTGTNGQTSATDFSTSGRAITFNANAQIDTAESTFGAGSSLLLDGNGDYLSMPDSADWQYLAGVDWCWEFVLRANGDFGANTDILSQATGTGAYPIRLYRIAGANGGIGVLAFNDTPGIAANFTTGAVFSPNAWHHLAVCRQGINWRVYVDGVQQATDAAGSDNSFDASDTMKIGAFNPPNATQWNGWIQCARYTLGEAIYLGGTSFTPPSTLFPTS